MSIELALSVALLVSMGLNAWLVTYVLRHMRDGAKDIIQLANDAFVHIKPEAVNAAAINREHKEYVRQAHVTFDKQANEEPKETKKLITDVETGHRIEVLEEF